MESEMKDKWNKSRFQELLLEDDVRGEERNKDYME